MKKNPLVFIDVETTGFDPGQHEIIEIGGVLVKQEFSPGQGMVFSELSEFEYKIKPEKIETAEPQALQVNGYNEVEWMFAPELKQVMTEVANKTAGATLVAHNLCFDQAFISAAFSRSGVESRMHYAKLDTISIAYAKLLNDQSVEKFSLRALADHFGIENEKAHTALADARVTFEVFKKLTAI